MRSKGRAIVQALAIGVGALPLGFLLGYFVVFASLKTPANSADGQGGLAEFLRIGYSVAMAGMFAIVAACVAIWRGWPRH